MSKNILLSGTKGKTYDLDELSNSSRINSAEKLTVQVWEWSPVLPSSNPHSLPNPPDLVVGQIWLSKLLNEHDDAERIAQLEAGNE